ncbi:MAG: hypothetical protein LBC79_06170 [Deltaproteobacteria bacterium]|jgi:tetratricopeptide (TPR) repeat protein|nr:hypothetical protein [Deltaproteobacteria bacterium]
MTAARPLPAPPPRRQEAPVDFSERGESAAFSPRLFFDLDAPPLRDIRAAEYADILDERLGKGREAALETAARASARKPGNIHYNLEHARQLIAAGRLDHARQILDAVLNIRGQNALALSLMAYIHMRENSAAEALRLFSLALEQEPADAFSQINAHHLRRELAPAEDSTPVAEMPKVTLATSLPPHEIENSRRAVDSWLALGFQVISLNTEAECRALGAHFPRVRFCRCEDTARRHTGKDHQYVDALLDALAEYGDEVCAVVNADAAMQGGRKAWAHMAQAAAADFVFASRVNLRSLDYREGHLYHGGFDGFLFPKTFLARVPRTRFIIGQPFWDIFFPSCARLAQIHTQYVYSPALLHKTHALHWNEELFIHLGFHLLELFAPSLGMLLSSHAGSRRYFLNTAGIFSEVLNHALRGGARPLFCPGALFANCMAPVDSFYWTGAEKTLIVW